MPASPRPIRLGRSDLSRHLAGEPPSARRTALALRRAVLRAAPMASEAVKFHVLCYYHADASFGAIGGAICMIEIRKGRVFLSFIHGSRLDDPATRLSGTAKFKRSARVESPAAAADPALRDLVVQAAALRPWD